MTSIKILDYVAKYSNSFGINYRSEVYVPVLFLKMELSSLHYHPCLNTIALS